MPPAAADLAPYADIVLRDATIPELPNHYRGKVRENYDLPDGRRIIIATDRLSAFDRIITAVPLKGQVLTQIARFWFERTADLCPNHVIEYPDPNVLVCRRLEIMPVEVVVRDYLAAPPHRHPDHVQGGPAGDVRPPLPRRDAAEPEAAATILTPTSKAFDAGHDEEMTPAQIVAAGLLTQAQWDKVSGLALALFARGREIAAARGLILVDTKYEFGFDPAGEIVLADEIHTPDSSRYWFAGSYPSRFAAGQPPQSFDKDFVRSWVVARCDPYKDPIPEIPAEVKLEAARIYISAFETITGQRFPLPAPAGRCWSASGRTCGPISDPAAGQRQQRHRHRRDRDPDRRPQAEGDVEVGSRMRSAGRLVASAYQAYSSPAAASPAAGASASSTSGGRASPPAAPARPSSQARQPAAMIASHNCDFDCRKKWKTPSAASPNTRLCSRFHRLPSFRIQPSVEVQPSTTSPSSATKPMVR